MTDEKATEKQIELLNTLWEKWVAPFESRKPSDDNRLEAYIYMMTAPDWSGLTKQDASRAISWLKNASSDPMQFGSMIIAKNAYHLFGDFGDMLRVIAEKRAIVQTSETPHDFAARAHEVARQDRIKAFYARIGLNENGLLPNS